MTRISRRIAAASITAALLSPPPTTAEVVSESDHRFRVTHTLTVDAPPTEVFRALHEDVGRWWSADHTYSGDAGNLSIDLTPGGWFKETLPDGGFTRHLQVIHVQPGKVIRFAGGLGPLQAMPVSGVMTWSVREEGGGTEVTFDYHVSGESEPPLSQIAAAVDRVIGEQAARLKTHVEDAPAEETSQ